MTAMRPMTDLEKTVFNDGERLIPGVTHGLDEVVRHLSSYSFFARVIRHDLESRGERPDPASIVDFGSGVGFGCRVLAELPSVQVHGVDISAESIALAQCYFAKDNITLEQTSLLDYVPAMPEFDYVVSRNVLEHIPGGLDLARTARWRQRLLIDVPYDEGDGNPHHVMHRIREADFAGFPRAELFFQDMAGVTYDLANKPKRPNLIVCVCSREGLPPVSSFLRFPLPAWVPGPAEGLITLPRKTGILVPRRPGKDASQQRLLDPLVYSACDRESLVFLSPCTDETILGAPYDAYRSMLWPGCSGGEPAMAPPPNFQWPSPRPRRAAVVHPWRLARLAARCRRKARAVLSRALKRIGSGGLLPLRRYVSKASQRAEKIMAMLEANRCDAALVLAADWGDVLVASQAARRLGIPLLTCIGPRVLKGGSADRSGCNRRWVRGIHARALESSAVVLASDESVAEHLRRHLGVGAIVLPPAAPGAFHKDAAEAARRFLCGLLERAGSLGDTSEPARVGAPRLEGEV